MEFIIKYFNTILFNTYCSPLYYAVMMQNADIVELLVTSKCLDINKLTIFIIIFNSVINEYFLLH